jgi:hypothetical protein
MKITNLLILFLFLSLKGFSQENSPVKSYLKISYGKTEICVTSGGVITPVIMNNNNQIIPKEVLRNAIYTYIKESGDGKLEINKETGEINIEKSNLGTYLITMKFGNGHYNSSEKLILKNCN